MALSLFTRNREREVQSFVLNLLNNHCPSYHLGGEELRLESRANLTLVVLVVPVKDGKAQVDQSLVTVTKDFSNTGVSLVLSEPHSFEEVILGFQRRKSITFLRAEAKHLSPMGAGFFKLGMKLREVLSVDKYPELSAVAERFF